MTIAIRPVTETDLDRVADLVAQAYLADRLIRDDDEYLQELRAAPDRASQATVLVAAEDDVVLGSVTLAPAGSPYAEIALPGETEVRMLAVDPAARGRGVGELLVRAAVNQAIAGGAAVVILSTMPAMLTAQRMYERLGLERVPERDWTIEGATMLVYRTVVPLSELTR